MANQARGQSKDDGELAQAQIEEFRQAFQLFDKDGDGCITATELGGIMRSLGQFPTEDELAQMINEVDSDGNGSIEFEEFLEMLKKTAQPGDPDAESGLKDAFDTFDKDGNGQIERHELKEVMIRLGEDLTEDQLDEMFNEADTNGDGVITFDEFKAMMIQK